MANITAHDTAGIGLDMSEFGGSGWLILPGTDDTPSEIVHQDRYRTLVRVYDNEIYYGEVLHDIHFNYGYITSINIYDEKFDPILYVSDLYVYIDSSTIFGSIRVTSGNDFIQGNNYDDILKGATGNDSVRGEGGNDLIYGEIGSDNLAGGSGNDRLFGGEGTDSLFGNSGNDWLVGGAGSDNLDGGADRDTAVFSLSRASYAISRGASLNITSLSSNEGTDTLTNVERLEFSDGVLAFDISGNAGQAYRLYQAAFARTPDTPGLKYQTNALDTVLNLWQVAGNFIASPEFQSMYGSPATVTDARFVTLLYNNVLGRNPDQAGYDYHLANLAGGLTRAQLLVQFSESPENQRNVLPAIQDGIWMG